MAILGDDAIRASQSLIEARRRESRSEDPWYRRLVGDTGQKRLIRLLQTRTLTEFEQSGFSPSDIVEAGLDITALERFSPTELHAHGFTWDILISLGLGGGQIGKFTWRELNLFGVRKEQIFSLSTSAHDVLSIGLTVQQLHTLGFTREDLMDRGASPEHLEEVFGVEDVGMYLASAPLPNRVPSPPAEKSVTFNF